MRRPVWADTAKQIIGCAVLKKPVAARGQSMGILLGFAPFLCFALAANFWDAMAALMIGTAISGALLVKDLIRKQQPKILELGTLLMFAGLVAWAKLFPSTLTVLSVRLRVDMGLLLIILISMALRKPFTLQYARERVPPERWQSPGFARINFVITSVWALAFACIVAADLMMVYVPTVSIRVGIVVTAAALYGAYRFTGWYPKQASQP
jgi:hypothetical protein